MRTSSWLKHYSKISDYEILIEYKEREQHFLEEIYLFCYFFMASLIMYGMLQISSLLMGHGIQNLMLPQF